MANADPHSKPLPARPSASRGGAARALRRGALLLADLLYPRTCAACGTALLERDLQLCARCGGKLALDVGGDYCRICGEDAGPHLLHDGRCTACLRSRVKIERFVRVGRYHGALRRVVVAFKQMPQLDGLLGGLLAEAIRAEFDALAETVFVPIPSPLGRRLRRRYAPTELLAREVARLTGGRWLAALEMARRVRKQSELSATERETNIRGAFRVVPGLDIQGLRVCLIDDVRTTGATLREAAKVCHAAGAAHISAAVLAKAVLR